MQLQGKVAIITGASSGIGAAAARIFAREGATLILVARDENRLAGLRDDIGADRVAVLSGDVKDEQTAQMACEMAMQQFGRVDIAFNNVGFAGSQSSAEDLTLAEWNEIIAVNLTSAFLAAKYQLPAIKASKAGGSIIFTSSFVGPRIGFPGTVAYAAAKAGLTGLVKVLAAENGAHNIRVNALAPGGTDTPMNFAKSPDAPAGTQEFIEGLHALKRLAEPEEIAEAALFLASPASSFVTGATIFADGGASITKT